MSSSPIELLPWSDALKIGIPMVDDEHHGLVNAMNELHALLVLGHERQGCQEALVAMTEYVHTHFAHEEALMAETGFPRLEAHRELHRHFAEHVAELNATCPAPAADAKNKADDLLNYLRDWLINHILGADVIFAAYYKARGGR